MRSISRVLAALVVLGVGLGSGAVSRIAGFEVGFAVLEITPPVGWRRAGGYSERISTGVREP